MHSVDEVAKWVRVALLRQHAMLSDSEIVAFCILRKRIKIIASIIIIIVVKFW